ncbi:MAG TPA: hypothetical protein DD658_08815 [Deltaproteobacteria bacterium]|nr:MAG: hypothetical protein A2X88_04070 [Deltaproteobacteria bacterium GWC2_65_14]HBO70209.1 hypothetical protein [Deltaproteobacteria bacterium]
MERKKVFFVLHYLAGGGTERVVVRILHSLDRARFHPFLVVFQKKGVFLSELPQDVQVFDLDRYGSGGRFVWIYRFAKLIRKENPDMLFSFLWFVNLVAIVARFLSRVRCRLVVSERVSIDGAREGYLEDMLRRAGIFLLYSSADRIVPNSVWMGKQLVDRFGIPPRKVVAIPNPVDIDRIEARAREAKPVIAEESTMPLVIGMGRLTPQKGFDLLIRSMTFSRFPFRLVLIGEGEDQDRLQALSLKLGVTDRVVFTGFQTNPYPSLARAAVFALSSRFEGFPNALVEAMTLGIPCVSTRCPTGPEEIITDGVDGLLVPVEDSRALAGAIDRLLSDEKLRKKIGLAGRERVREFDVPRIMRRFESLIEEAIT